MAQSVLRQEARALDALADRLDESFVGLVEEILHLRGRVVLTGIGKSAIVAQKISATLNSTGTPALFMHAADAIHGDLGMVQPEDLVIALSKSGATPEVKVLIPLVRRRGTKLVALVGNVNSPLAQQADYVLDATVEREACLNNLAPTTSTTAAMAMGDALAVTLLEARSFSSSDFAELHPGGALGKQLYLKVSDIYPNHEVPAVAPTASLPDVIVEMTSKRLGCTAVVDAERQVLGLITDGDLRRMLTTRTDLSGVTAADIMTANPKSIGPDEFAVEALHRMQSISITQLLVVSEGALLGVVHLHDLIKEGLV